MTYLNTKTRGDIIIGYDLLIQQIIKDRCADGYFVNFMFNALPGKERTRIELMKAEVSRFHSLLARHVVRNPKSSKWRDLVPVFVGTPDYPVVKRKKTDVRLYQVNDGLHFNGILLLPSSAGSGGEGRRSRLREPLDAHVEDNSDEYLTSRLSRIDVTRLKTGTTMADYALKAFRRGRIFSDDILILK